MAATILAVKWWAVLIRGIAAILFGALTLVLPGITLIWLVLLFGAYALLEGVFALVAAARGTSRDSPRWALVLEGIVSIVAGALTFAWPGLTALVLLYVIAGWALVTGVLELFAAVRLRRHIDNEWWLALSGVLSLAFGVLMLIAPGAGALAVTLWIGAYAIVFGALLVALALRLRRAERGARTPMSRAA